MISVQVKPQSGVGGSAAAAPSSLEAPGRCPALEPRALRAGPRAMSCQHSPLVLRSPGDILSLTIPGSFFLTLISATLVSIPPNTFLHLSVSSLPDPLPQTFSPLRTFINSLLICLSWERKSFSFLTLILFLFTCWQFYVVVCFFL